MLAAGYYQICLMSASTRQPTPKWSRPTEQKSTEPFPSSSFRLPKLQDSVHRSELQPQATIQSTAFAKVPIPSISPCWTKYESEPN